MRQSVFIIQLPLSLSEDYPWGINLLHAGAKHAKESPLEKSLKKKLKKEAISVYIGKGELTLLIRHLGNLKEEKSESGTSGSNNNHLIVK